MKPALRSRVAGILLGAYALAATATATADEGNPPTSPGSPAIPCLERAIVVAYLHRFQDQVMQRWVVPEDSLGDQSVVVRFRLADDGGVHSWRLQSWTNRRVANSVELAFRHTGPAGPIPESAACLIGRAIDIRFENPY